MHSRLHDCLGPLQVKDESVSLDMPQHDAHTLSFRAEWKVSQYLILLIVVSIGCVLNHHFLLVSLNQFNAHLMIGKFNEGYFVRGARLKFSHCRVIWVGIGRGHIVTQSKASY